MSKSLEIVAILCILGLLQIGTASPVSQPDNLPENFIIGGNPTPEGTTFAALVVSFLPGQPNHGYIFTGSLITYQHILTVAQGIYGYTNWQVGLGSVHREEMQYFVPSQAIVHSDYSPLNLQHNLGILTLPHQIPPFLVNPIQLPPPFLQPSPMFRYYGFGITDYVDMNSVPNTLKHGFTSEIPIQNCSSIFGGQLITENSWCAQQFNTGLCHGDQGGPLVHFFENYIIAVASFWMVPCHGGYPDVFVRIEPYIGWINNITMSDN